jgi:hypothetical protein
MVATPFVKRKQQVLKPRGSPDMVLTLKPSLSKKRGQHRRNRQWRGIVGSAGVLARGKGTGWIAWEPERSRSRPRESKPTLGSSVEQLTWPGRLPPTFRERERKLRDTNREGQRGPWKRNK